MRPIRSVSVLMPTWQGIEFLDRVLTALAAQRCEVSWDFLAIDSGSTDGTLELFAAWAPRFPVPLRVQSIDKSEFDHGDTRNLLAARSQGDLLVYLTQDAIPSDERWLAKLVANFAAPEVAAAYCRNVPRPDAWPLTKIFSAGDPGYTAGRRETRLPAPEEYARMDAHTKRVLYNFNDVASAVRREVWELHPFPRTWFGEDILLARALLEAGHTVVYDDQACVEHSHDYGVDETRARARIDGRFNAEWLDRVCVASKHDATVLTARLLESDRAALRLLQLSDAEYGRQLQLAAELRAAAFEGLWEGGRVDARRGATQVLRATKLKILYVLHGFPPDTWAGTEVYTLNLAKAMQARGHEVVILARSPGRAGEEQVPDFTVCEERLTDSGSELRVLRLINRLHYRRLADTFVDERADAAFLRVLATERPDVVHFQHLIHLSTNFVELAKEEGCATFLTMHDYWALCPRVQLIRPDGERCEESMGAGCFLCIKERRLEAIPAAKKAGELLGPIAELVAQATGRDEYADLMERHAAVLRAYKAADLRASPSRFLRKKMVDTADFDAHSLLYSDNGMRTDHVRALTKRPHPQGKVRFGFVGTLVWYKGGETLIEAMKLLEGRPCELHVWGSFDPKKDEHHARLAQLAGSNVVFHGRFDNSKLSEVHAELDVLVVPSVWFENSPVTIHEAWLTKTPVVASDIGGMAEYVRHEIDGLLFHVGDARSLAAALVRFVDEPDLGPRLSEAAPEPKTIEDDAATTEFRYRGLVCAAKARKSARLARPLFDAQGIDTCARVGGCEQQGASYLLMRPQAQAAWSIAGTGGGRRALLIEQFVLGGEPQLLLGAEVLVDGVRVGSLVAVRGAGVDRLDSTRLELDLPANVQRVELRTPGDLHARIARVQVLRLAEQEG